MAGGKARLVRRRTALWKKDPRCYLCKIYTILPADVARDFGVPPGDLMRHVPDEVLDRMATIDHLVNRFEPLRKINEGHERTKLACRKCNSQRGIDDYMSLPTETRKALSTGKYVPSYTINVSGGFPMKLVAKIQDVGGHLPYSGRTDGAVRGSAEARNGFSPAPEGGTREGNGPFGVVPGNGKPLVEQEAEARKSWRIGALTKTELGCRIRSYFEAMKSFLFRFINNPSCARSS